ncbi:NADH:ubiquinone oxidoreductase [Candidatus Falkowbacteria bacterium]|jgi:sulfhydrogenase subunit delta|nr:NADH:ubiquinone oxidoreductase [Candidatus Falkowbacteria bacterium]MBT5503458.1 NADH:ubiquinone oxidoreductase [Candidatus Falkowbacteria bacterium]MBT6574306.1 NADH:ubiquinone oxidoreductase [Candidatus Falkowbacteria bacterium]MBT7348251.1 NADH:ubiquinone oxidoreductase [Candidatus Falkowbacteria bacterium]MBT7500230.1 NADH:ubiquinone oxidoreductase [Candidatus Falkowbacteria bacterium]
MNNKIKVGIFPLTGCEGCCVAILDLPNKLLELNEKIEIVNFRLFEEDEHSPDEKYDIVFVEGSPLTTRDIKQLKLVRKNSKYVISIGSCAHMGGIYHLKMYQDKNKIHDYVYQGEKGIENLDVKPLSAYVKVDFSIPGCPITGEEFYDFVYQLLIGKEPAITQNPVCYECQVRGQKCVLQYGEVCMGPITQGGCDAICTKSMQGCWGCRGLVEDAEVDNLIKKLKEKYSDKEISKFFEVFGVKELVWKKRNKLRK